MEHEVTLDDVLVVTPYNAEVAKLTAALPDGARIGTVDKFQGQEAPVVIYSMATSSAEDVPRSMEFLYDLHRVNVAISRARAVRASSAARGCSKSSAANSWPAEPRECPVHVLGTGGGCRVTRQMRDEEYRSSAWERRYDGARGPLNRLIDELIASSGEPMPYSGPEYGGVNAEALLLLQDPGPKAQCANEGSGFLSIENDDPSAELLGEILGNVGLAPPRLVFVEHVPLVHQSDAHRRRTPAWSRASSNSARSSSELFHRGRAHGFGVGGIVVEALQEPVCEPRKAVPDIRLPAVFGAREQLTGSSMSRAEGIDRVTAVYHAAPPVSGP